MRAWRNLAVRQSLHMRSGLRYISAASPPLVRSPRLPRAFPMTVPERTPSDLPADPRPSAPSRDGGRVIVLRPSSGLGAPPAPRALALPRAALLPHLARHQGPLQADRARRGLGGPPAAASHGGLQRSSSAGSRSVPSDGVPYPLFAYAALVPWTFFANGADPVVATAWSAASTLITKVYFPRARSSRSPRSLPGCVDFAIAFVVLLGDARRTTASRPAPAAA